MGGGIPALVGHGVGVGVVLPDAVVLDVPDVVSQAFESAKPIQVEPGLSAERIGAHHAEHHEPTALTHRALPITLQGLPAATAPAGTLPVTSEPAPITA